MITAARSGTTQRFVAVDLMILYIMRISNPEIRIAGSSYCPPLLSLSLLLLWQYKRLDAQSKK